MHFFNHYLAYFYFTTVFKKAYLKDYYNRKIQRSEDNLIGVEKIRSHIEIQDF